MITQNNLFDWSEKATPQGIPAGAYTGVFEGISAVAENPEKGFGPGYKFTWAIPEGPHAGQKATRIVSIPKGKPGPGNALGKMLVALKGGGTPAEGENLDPTQWVGRKYTVIVQAGPKGGTRVETVAPAVG